MLCRVLAGMAMFCVMCHVVDTDRQTDRQTGYGLLLAGWHGWGYLYYTMDP